MKFRMLMRSAITMSFAAMVMFSISLQAKDPGAPATVPVRMTVTASVDDGKRMPVLEKEDIILKKGKDRLQVTGWVPAQGDRAGLELFILIDDASASSLG